MEIRAGVTVSSSTTTLSDEYNSGIEKICELISQVTLEVRQADCAVLDDGVRVDNISIPLLSPSAMIQIIVDRSCVSKSAFRGLIGRVSGADVAAQLSPKLSERCDRELVHLGTGFPAAQGAAVGVLCCDPDNANALVAKGYPVIFCANTPGPEQMTAVFLASGLLFGTGGATSHVAVIARGAGLPCILGIAGLIVDTAGHYASFGTEIIREGEWIAMDGNTGSVYRGKGELEPPPDSASMSTRQLLKECDKLARIHVYANADTASEAGAAYGLGAQGIGLCRIEHMLLRPERLSLLQRILVALFACQDLTDLRYTARRRVSQYQKSEGASELLQEAELKCLESRAYQTYIADLRCLEEFLTDDIRGLIDVSAGRNVVIRLLDPPLSEFLNEAAIDLVSESLSLSSAVKTRLRAFVGERNPMLGLRGIRLCLRAPELTDAQLRGIFRAAASSAANLCPVNLDILVPFVSDPGELIALRSRANSIADEVLCDRGGEVRYRVGAMVETPRAAILSEEIARVADFLSFGTNDLTQFTWACSRDSSEGSVFSGGVYCDQEFEPFSIFDKSGVGRLIALAISSARRASPDITIGVCGEYGGDPRALEFFGQVGVNYVSCALSSIPVARLRAGQLSLEGDNFGD
jgi:pyruvate,orthophosphate dikinase